MSPSDGGCGVKGYPCTHWGVDLFADDPRVFAPEGGEVVAVANGTAAPWVGFGPGLVVIKGKSGFFHLLSHLALQTITVRVGDRVSEGQLLAQFDTAHGHSHYEVRKKLTGPSDTNTIDPSGWLALQKVTQTNWALFGLLVGGLAGIGWMTYRSRVAHG